MNVLQQSVDYIFAIILLTKTHVTIVSFVYRIYDVIPESQNNVNTIFGNVDLYTKEM